MAEDKNTETATVLRHVGVDDAAQGEVKLVEPVTPQRGRGTADQKANSVAEVEIAGSAFPPKDDPMRESLQGRETIPFRKQYVLGPNPTGNFGMTDCSTDIAFEALKMGYRPVGDAEIDDAQNHPDGVSKIVTWSIPVKPVVGKHPDELDPSIVADNRPSNETLRYGEAKAEPSQTEQQAQPQARKEPEAKPSPTPKVAPKAAPKKD